MMTQSTLKSLVRGEGIPMPNRPTWQVKILRLPPKKEKAALAALLRVQRILEKRDAK